jgi:DNA-binding CsgD family transcriptional regulator
LLEGMLEALSIPGFLCDRRGMVRAVTPAAENAVSAGGIQLVKGRLQLPRPEDSRRLEEAIRAAADPTGPRRPMFHTVVARGPDGALPLILDVIALPARDYEFTFAPRVLVTSGAPQPAEQRRADVLRAAYALTEAEADIALRLSAGESACVIAAARRVTVGTVRAQLKASMAKLGVKRQAALVARLGQLRL